MILIEAIGRDIYEFKDVPIGLSLLKKEPKSPEEKIAAVSFVKYFSIKCILLFLFVFTSIGSLFLHPLSLWHLTISVPILSFLLYHLLLFGARKKVGKNWFEIRKQIRKEDLTELKKTAGRLEKDSENLIRKM